ncbi:two-component sensor histidine kinase [Lysinibacillus sp. PLM2]|nr:two-component sensor histidine kinase [Lysinibacillus sp. PLM2]
MKNKGKILLTLFLITWVVFAFTTFSNFGQKYIGQSYFKSENFVYQVENYKAQLGRYVLNPFDANQAKENISVTDTEINDYRYYYGSLSDQIESIQAQYRERISLAESENNTTLKNQLILERDQKIEDITQNFNSDEYVEEKIRAKKAQAIDYYAEQEEKQRNEFLNNEYKHFAYSFKNVETGETFDSNSKKENILFEESFGKQKPNFIVDNSVEINTYDGNYALPEEIANFTAKGEVAQFEGAIYFPSNLLANSSFEYEYLSFIISKYIFYFIWTTGLLAVIALFTAARPSLSQFANFNEMEKIFSKWPIDVRLVLVFISAMISLGIMDNIGSFIQYNSIYYSQRIITEIVEIAAYMSFMFIFASAAVLGAVWIWRKISNPEGFKREFKNSFTYLMMGDVRDLFLNRSIAFHVLFVLGVAFFAGVGIVGAMMDTELAVIYLLLFVFVALPSVFLFLRRMGYLNKIIKHTENMAEGRLTSDIKVKGKSILAKHATNLNSLREGVKKSMTEQAKSERLKTELITNVSHDLRTPLTSIITYTDLLKNPEITDEERQQYIQVLDQKSARLRTLIEDLFEVSKMASGNIEITKQRIDLTQFFQQALGEHEETFQQAGLELKISKPEQPLFAYVDGQKMWRVLDNLVVNAQKYSLKGTRVYVSLRQVGNQAEFVVKNISNYELGDNVEELTERFKRADASRHTDGSGLGLAIAQSIVDLHNGRMKIEVDGDMFKVIVLIPIDF